MKLTEGKNCLNRLFNKQLNVLGCSVFVTQLVFSPCLYANPAGGNIVGGTGNISQSNLTTTINQFSHRLAIDWQSFNVNQNESVNFNQPGRSAIALNRILDQSASQIHGSINANGQIILVNPNGVFFGKNATVNAGGLFVAALDVSSDDFMRGELNFKALENTSGLIVNEGRLEVIDGGALVLLGQQINNRGLLVAHFGTVALVAGSDILVRFDHYDQLSIQINQAVLADILELDEPAILNSGLIDAHQGNVVLTAKQADAIKSSLNNMDRQQVFSFTSGQVIERDGVVYLAGPDGDISNLGVIDIAGDKNAGTLVLSGENINHRGEINADTLSGKGGTVKFDANDTVLLTDDSVVSAQALEEGEGGTVHVLGDRVGLVDHALIDVSGANGGGEVLIGGDYQGKNPKIKNAQAVYLGEHTRIHADALNEGDAGKIIVWSDKTTRAYGELTARGGQQAGDGGFIETSSHDYADLAPDIDVSAVNGSHGHWLIDPSVLTISNGANSNPIFPVAPDFTSTDNISNLFIGTLQNALQDGANVTVQTSVPLDIPNEPCIVGVCLPPIDITPETTQVAGESYFYGDIILVDDLDIDNIGSTTRDGENASTLTLTAHRDIVINGAIFDSDGDNTSGMPATFTPDGDILNLILQANTGSGGNAGIGSVRINNNINLQGGNFTASGREFVQVAGTTINTRVPAPGASSGFDPVAVFGGAGVTPDGDVNIIATNGGISANGNFIVAGDTNLIASGSIALINNANDFGLVNINGGTAVTIADANNLTVNINNNSVTSIGTGTATVGGNFNIVDVDLLGTQLSAMDVSGDLTVNAQGNITDIGDIVVRGFTNLTVPDGRAIILDSSGNNFSNDLNIIANTLSSLTVRDSSAFELQDGIVVTGDINLRGASLLTNNFTLGNASTLTLTSTAGDIDQNTIISHAGPTVLSATGGDINLTMTNNLSSVQVLAAGTATINNGANDIDIVSVDSTDILDIDAQDITQSGDIAATTVDLTAVDTVSLDRIDATTLNVTAAGGISDTGVITVTGLTTLDAGTSNIILNSINNLNDVEIVNASAVEISEFDNINISGNMASLDIFAGFGVGSSIISNILDSALTVSGSTTLGFITDGAINLDNFTEVDLALRPRNSLQGPIDILSFSTVITDLAIRNDANIQLSSSAIISNLTLDTTAAISQNSFLRVAGNTRFQAASIDLNNASNDFNAINISNTATSVIADTNDVSVTSVLNGDLTLNAGGLVNIEGDMNNLTINTTAGGVNSGVTTLTVASNTIINATAAGDIDFATNQVNLENLNIVQANDVLINEVDNLSVNSATVNGLLDIDATDTVSVNGTIANLEINTANTISLSGNIGIVNALTTSGGIQNGATALRVIDTAILDAGASDITLDNAGNDIARIRVIAAQNVNLRDINALQLMDVTSNSLTVNTAGNLTQMSGTILDIATATNLNSGNGDITLTEANLLNTLGISGANNATVVNDQALVLNDSSVTSNINISTTTGDLSLNSISAGGTASFSTVDSLIDANANALNVVATTASFTAVNGIGAGAIADTTKDIDIQVSNLSALNTGSGDINIKNTGGDITLTSIVNNASDTGNFNFETNDDVFIDNITLVQNLTEEFFPDGTGTVSMRTANGSFLGVGDEDINNPDITATNLRLIGFKGNLGTLQRPLVLDISGKVELLMRASLDPIYIEPVPNADTDIRDNSLLQFTSADTLAAANGVQVTEVETLLDIDPAIFTDLRHFVVGSDPVLLPRDQRFDVENEDEDEDEEYFRRISGETEEVLEN